MSPFFSGCGRRARKGRGWHASRRFQELLRRQSPVPPRCQSFHCFLWFLTQGLLVVLVSRPLHPYQLSLCSFASWH